MSVQETYHQELKRHGFQSDPAQLRAVQALDECASAWRDDEQRRHSVLKSWLHRPALPRGVYLHGGVGRGKSFLMDCFFHAVPVPQKTRLHFHEFMREVHRELYALQGTANPLDVLAKRIAKRHRLICFDEFHITDVTDAMILHRLLSALFHNGVGLVATSNFHPDQLYPGGLHRERILPAIALLKQRLHVLQTDNGTDYRLRTLKELDLYCTPLGPASQAKMREAFERLAEKADEDLLLHIESRQIAVLRKAGGVVWFDFKTLCGGPRSQNDYLEIASQFHTVLLSDVPLLPVRMASETRRFMALIDVLYDRRVKLMVSAAAPVQDLYQQGPLSYEFQRTVSRINEMQSSEFLALDRRLVDTRLTA
jgi:cell division protein ZapE